MVGRNFNHTSRVFLFCCLFLPFIRQCKYHRHGNSDFDNNSTKTEPKDYFRIISILLGTVHIVKIQIVNIK